MSQYRFDYDDPYKILAHYIVAYSRPADVLRVLRENSYIKNCIIKEVRGLDIGGNYIDCIIENILEDKYRMKYMHQLDELASFYYQHLDKERLRNEIRAVLSEAGIEIEDYSTGGNV